MSAENSFTVRGADGNPVEIPASEWFIDSKPRTRRAMKSSCFSPAARIYMYLSLATMGFKQELAVKLEARKQVPVQPVDVCAATGLPLKHFREYMACLEAAGLAKIEGWTKGRIKLYSYAVPRDVEVPKIVPRAGTIFEGCPPELASILNHYRIRFPAGFVPRAGTIEELERLARVAKEAELSLRAYAKVPCGSPHIYKEERNERNSERNNTSPLEQSSSKLEVLSSEEQAEKTEALKSTTTKTNSQTPSQENGKAQWASEHDELIALIRDSVGAKPDQKLVWGIEAQLEIRGGSLRAYLDDIRPRLGRLKKPPGFAFFLSQAQQWGGPATTEAPDPRTKPSNGDALHSNGRCPHCSGLGKIGQKYCSCGMGVDLERVEVRLQRAAALRGEP